VNGSRVRIVLLVVAFVGLTWGLSGARFGPAVYSAVFAACGVAQFIVAGLLARGILKPGGMWGWSPRAQLLQGCGWLLLAGFDLAHEVSSACIQWPVGLALDIIPALLLFAGFRVEHQARACHGSAKLFDAS